ncbi:MAG: CPBP family intramembrane metalloprotease [Bacilli bacterium]|nr:CPBP family intramembrane metalloprotease [Bacilli bacterium]
MIINQEKNKTQYFLKGFLAIFIYFSISITKGLPFAILKIDTENISKNVLNLYSFSLEMLILLIIYMLFEKELNEGIKDLKKNHEKYYNTHFKTYIIGLAIMMISNSIINVLGGGISENESLIRNEFLTSPIYTFASAVFMAPIIEELIFRFCFKAMIKNNVLYIMISGLIFGMLHLTGISLNYMYPLYLMAYAASGFAFSYMMVKTNNIFTSWGFHLMHNGILLTLQAISLFL